MRFQSFIIFFSIFLTVYGLGNFYVYIRGLQAIPRGSFLRYVYTVFFLLIAIAYIAGRFLERAAICRPSDVLIWIGSFHLALFLYLFLGFFFMDILFFFSRISGIFFESITAHVLRTRQITAMLVAFFAIVMVIIGYINARIPKITEVEMQIPHTKNVTRNVNAVLVTDIHLGIIISNSRLEKLVSMINGLKPDIVFFAGDIVDEDIAPVIEKNLGELLSSIKSTFGVFAVTGNHEYIGGADSAVKYLEAHGVRFLRDTAVLVDNLFYLAGREDKSAPNFGGKSRKTLNEILQGLDSSYPVVVMDHQPNFRKTPIPKNVAAILSGHTHNGQLWPINHIVSKIFTVPYGYRQIGTTHLYVSSGYGTWGPPVRTVNRPEIVHLTMKFVPENRP